MGVNSQQVAQSMWHENSTETVMRHCINITKKSESHSINMDLLLCLYGRKKMENKNHKETYVVYTHEGDLQPSRTPG